MKPRYLAAKLFLGVAFLSAIVVAAAYEPGPSAEDYLNSLFLLFLPRLILFSVAILSVSFAVIYFLVEKEFRREMNMPLTLIHLTSFLLAMIGHAIMVRFWTRVLGQPHLASAPLPVWATLLFLAGVAVCWVAFLVNIFRTARQTLPKT